MSHFLLSFLLAVTLLDPIEGYPDFTPDISFLRAELSSDSLSIEIQGLHYHYEDAAYILIYVDQDNNPLTGTHWSKGENPRYLGIGAEYMLVNFPDTVTWVYHTPDEYLYEYLGTIPSSFDTFWGDRFSVTLKWIMPGPTSRMNLVIFGGSEEFTDDRVPDSGYVKIGERRPLDWISRTEIRCFWQEIR